MNDDELLDAFENCRIDADAWTHALHVRVAYLYLRRYPFADAVDKMRAGLRAFLAARQIEDGPMTGYNETITVAWMHIIHATICEHGVSETSEQFLAEQPQLGSRLLLRLFYSRAIWRLRDCKSTFVAPDLTALPTPRQSMSP